MTDIQIIASNLKKIGIRASVQGVAVSVWTSEVANGNYDLTVHWSGTGPSPYFVYDNWLNDTLSAPVGKAASGDYERWYSPQTQSLLAQYSNATTSAGRLHAIQGLEGVVASSLPVIPLVYAADWAEYQSNKYTGWPSPANPYEPASPYPPGEEVVVTHLRPVG